MASIEKIPSETVSLIGILDVDVLQKENELEGQAYLKGPAPKQRTIQKSRACKEVDQTRFQRGYYKPLTPMQITARILLW
jgi:hypothetical protein